MTSKDPKVVAIESFFDAYANDDRTAIAAILSENIEWTIPGHHPLSGTKHGIDEVLAFFTALAAAGFQAETFFLEASDEFVVDIHRGYSTAGVGQVDTNWLWCGTSTRRARSTESSTCRQTSTRWTSLSGPTSR